MSGLVASGVLTFAQTGTLSTSTDIKIVAPCDGEILAVTGAVNVAPVGAALVWSVLKNGDTIVSGQSIAANATTVAASSVPTNGKFVAGDVLTVNVTQVGSGTAGANLHVTAAFAGVAAATVAPDDGDFWTRAIHPTRPAHNWTD